MLCMGASIFLFVFDCLRFDLTECCDIVTLFFLTLSLLLAGGGGGTLHTLFWLLSFRRSSVWVSTCWSTTSTQAWHDTLFWLLLFQQSFAWSFHLLKRHPTMTSHFILTPVVPVEFCLGFHLLKHHPTVTSHFILTPVVPAEFCLGFHLLKHHGHPSMTSHSILILLFQRSFVWASTCWSATRPWCHSICWRASLSSMTTASTTVSETVTRYQVSFSLYALMHPPPPPPKKKKWGGGTSFSH